MTSDLYPILLFPIRLETRFVPNQLLVRLYPDQLAVETHEPKLTRDELVAGRVFRLAHDAATEDETKRGAWRELARRFGSPRAAWIAEQVDGYAGVDSETLGEDSWTRAPAVRTLPDRFIVTAYTVDGRVYSAAGERIPAELPVLRDPTEADAGDDELFDEQSRWVVDFPQAERVGMAVRIPSDPRDPPLPNDVAFSRVVAVGIRDSTHPHQGSRFVERWIHSHHYTSGFAFLEHGTPTNNTKNTKSGYSDSQDDYDRSYQSEFGDVPEPALQPEEPRTTAEQLGRALGLGATSDVLRQIENAFDASDSYAQEMNTALWPATGDSFLRFMLPGAVSAPDRAKLWEHVRRWVRARGPMPALRIGNVPYGVLPVTRVGAAAGDNPAGWSASKLDSPALDTAQAEAWERFDAGLHVVLEKLHHRWREMADDAVKVPRIRRGSDDPDGDLLQILGMDSGSVAHWMRPFVDERSVKVLLLVLRNRLFGGQSPNDGIRQWLDTWEHEKTPGKELLEELGVPATVAATAPHTRLLGWDPGGGLPVPRATDPENPDDNPDAYLSLLCTQGAQASPAASEALLYDLCRRSLGLEDGLASAGPSQENGVHAALCRLSTSPVIDFFNQVTEPDQIVARIRDDPEFGIESPRAYGVRPTLARRILEVRDTLPGGRFESIGQIDDIYGVGPDTLHDILESFRERPRQLDVDGLFRDTLDLCTHRLDAWLTAFATKRLDAMRQRNPHGVHLGAYGWVENLERAGQPASGGYVHAPSLGQAGAAAILRNAFLTHQDGGADNTFHINLTSDRVRRALRLLAGVREGQELGALLGYQFERGLHEQGGALEQYLGAFREACPMVAHRETPQSASGESAESVAARNVVDGLELAAKWRPNQLLHDISPALPSTHGALTEELDKLLDALDGVTDLLLNESVFQSVQGNFERAGAALEAATGNARPPEIESVVTPSSGTNLAHRVCLLVGCEPEHAPDASGPRGAAEPRFDAWFGELLGDMGEIRCQANFQLPGEGDGARDSLPVSLRDLGIGPLDFLYLSSVPLAGEETELEQRIGYHVRNKVGLPSDTRVQVDPTRAESGGTRGLAEAVELARHVLGLVAGSRTLTATSLCRPEDASTASFTDESVVDLGLRVERGLSDLDGIHTDLTNATTRDAVVAPLLAASRFGIQGAIPAGPDDPDLPERRGIVLAEIAKRRSRCTELLAEAASPALEPTEKVSRLTSATKVLFGDGFVVLPTFTPVGSSDLGQAMIQTDIVGPSGEERVRLWLQQVAQTHPAVRRLDDSLMSIEAWRTAAILSDTTGPGGPLTTISGPELRLRVAQLPLCRNRPWMALADAERSQVAAPPVAETDEECRDPEDGRPRGVVSIVAIAPEVLDVACLTGLLIDQWDEHIPSDTVTTGVSFQYDQPGSQAPQSLLLAVPSQLEVQPAPWTTDALLEIVNDTLDLAKIRAVDLDAFSQVGSLFPSLFLAMDPDQPGWERDAVFDASVDAAIAQ